MIISCVANGVEESFQILNITDLRAQNVVK